MGKMSGEFVGGTDSMLSVSFCEWPVGGDRCSTKLLGLLRGRRIRVTVIWRVPIFRPEVGRCFLCWRILVLCRSGLYSRHKPWCWNGLSGIVVSCVDDPRWCFLVRTVSIFSSNLFSNDFHPVLTSSGNGEPTQLIRTTYSCLPLIS